MSQNDDPTIDFDLDALQAEINMAMAETQAVVSSWVKPSNNVNRRPKRSFEEMEKELQEYMRRPPRLGVGHPIPEQVGPSAREETKLKNKLVANDKKRKREQDGNDVPKPREEVDDEEEESGKGESSSSTKFSRPDPFSLPKKKAKRKDELRKFNVNGISTLNGVSTSSHVNGIPPRTQARGQSTTSNGNSDHDETRPSRAERVSPLPILGEDECSSKPDHVIPPRVATANSSSTPDSGRPEPDGKAAAHVAAPTVNGTLGSVATPSTKGPEEPPTQAQQLASPAPPNNSASPESSKKKKKKKKKKHKAGQPPVANGIASNLNGMSESEAQTTTGTLNESGAGTITDERPFVISVAPDVERNTNDNQGPEEEEAEKWSRFGDSDIGDTVTDSATLDGGSVDTGSRPRSSTDGIPKSMNHNLASHIPKGLFSPLLNLNGPPPPDITIDECAQGPSSPSKKRRKRRKKHKRDGTEINS